VSNIGLRLRLVWVFGRYLVLSLGFFDETSTLPIPAVPLTWLSSMADWAFPIAVVRTWNGLPSDVKSLKCHRSDHYCLLFASRLFPRWLCSDWNARRFFRFKFECTATVVYRMQGRVVRSGIPARPHRVWTVASVRHWWPTMDRRVSAVGVRKSSRVGRVKRMSMSATSLASFVWVAALASTQWEATGDRQTVCLNFVNYTIGYRRESLCFVICRFHSLFMAFNFCCSLFGWVTVCRQVG